MGAIACNVITVMAGVVTTIIASIVLQKYFNQIYHRNQFTDPYGWQCWTSRLFELKQLILALLASNLNINMYIYKHMHAYSCKYMLLVD